MAAGDASGVSAAAVFAVKIRQDLVAHHLDDAHYFCGFHAGPAHAENEVIRVEPGHPRLDLGDDLVGSAEDETVARMAQAPNPVIVFSAATQDEGEIVRGLLESEGIPAIFTDHSSPILGDALSVTGDHMGDVLVATADVERAKALIESYQGATVTDDMVGDPSQAEE